MKLCNKSHDKQKIYHGFNSRIYIIGYKKLPPWKNQKNMVKYSYSNNRRKSSIIILLKKKYENSK